jgi:dihydropteroate synthase
MPTPQDTLELNHLDINRDPNQDIDIRIKEIDDELSKRSIALDPAGYFIIYIDLAQSLICAKHFANDVNEKGLAVDPVTGKVIPAKGKVDRQPTHVFQAQTAKQLCVEIFESGNSMSTQTLDIPTISMLDHAAYIGREAQKAEWALRHNQVYIQD